MKTADLLKKPLGYVVATIVCSLYSFILRIDISIIGLVTVIDDFKRYVSNLLPNVYGLIVSFILILAAISSFFASQVADTLGQSCKITIRALMFALSAALEAALVYIAMFVLGWVIKGIEQARDNTEAIIGSSSALKANSSKSTIIIDSLSMLAIVIFAVTILTTLYADK
ncbi:hypothetical protein V502_07034 [Pseudogymnoascus sp. VKM F-4520 (FW-2644)]|nr:hypothetical protein V502_07034 [Pseudogymnoascus sp. VKM F-4520 (FW-2644)]